MKPFIQITRYLYEEPYHLQLVMAASNGRQRGKIEYYANADDLTEIASVLKEFPRHPTDVYRYEIGSQRSEDKWPYFLRLRLVTTDSPGRYAIHLAFNNNREIPYRESSEFCIPVEAAALNQLGSLFQEFARLKHEVLYWNPVEGKLYPTRIEAEEIHPADRD
jgi:hypothetical protein